MGCQARGDWVPGAGEVRGAHPDGVQERGGGYLGASWLTRGWGTVDVYGVPQVCGVLGCYLRPSRAIWGRGEDVGCVLCTGGDVLWGDPEIYGVFCVGTWEACGDPGGNRGAVGLWCGGKDLPCEFLFLFFLKRSAQVCDCSWGALGLGRAVIYGVSPCRAPCGMPGGDRASWAHHAQRGVERGCHHKGHPARGQRCHKGA